MPSPAAPATDRLSDLVDLIRPEVRAERAYRVATAVDRAAKLDQNESPYGLPPEIEQAAIGALRATAWNRYPADRPHRLAAALAERLDWPEEGLILGRGSNELTPTVGLAFVQPGTPVVLPSPMFALYGSIVRVFGGTEVKVAPEPDFSHSADAVIAAMHASEAPLTVVCSPNNPTGASFAHDDLRRLAAAAPGFLLIDEAYYEFIEGPTALDVARDFPNVLVMRTFSKAMGLAGVRLGYLMGHPAIVDELQKPRLPFLVDCVSEAMGLAMLERGDLIRERVAVLNAERVKLRAALAEIEGVETMDSSANFFIMRTPVVPADLLAALLREGVRIRNVSGYPELAGWVRASVGLPEENRAFLDALKRVLP
ncbi:MAG: histidinol-phosphate transaminase [Bacteroidota bacterium]